MVERSGQGMNLMYELSVQEAKPLPDFTGTDDYFVSVTLNGLIIDKAMLSVINRIGDERMESLSTDDFLAIDALYHQNCFNQKQSICLNLSYANEHYWFSLCKKLSLHPVTRAIKSVFGFCCVQEGHAQWPDHRQSDAFGYQPDR